MAGEQFVNLTYRGLEVGKRLRISSLDAGAAYIEHHAPMPVGTELAVTTDEGLRVPVRVVRVHEQTGSADRPAGMRVGALSLDDAARPWWEGLVGEAEAVDHEAPAGDAEEAAEAPSEEAAEGSPEEAEASSEGDTGDAEQAAAGEEQGRAETESGEEQGRAETESGEEQGRAETESGEGKPSKKKRRRRRRKNRG